VARTTKKRQQQLKHDKFRDTTMHAFDRLSHRYEGRGHLILYALGAAAAVVLLVLVFNWWRGREADKARLALGKAIEIHAAEVSATPQPNAPGPVFPSERERAQKAVEEFQRVQREYGSPYSEVARYFAAVNLVTIEREKGIAELEQLTRSGDADVAARARFSLAQAREAEGKYDDAARLYQELLNDRTKNIAENTLKLRLANVYEKQGKKEEAVNLLYPMVEAARNAKTKDGKPQPQSEVISAAADKLQELSPERYAQLPKDEAPARTGLPNF
jgi:TolA-binding protein